MNKEIKIQIENEVDVCSICLREYKDSPVALLRNCGHVFHMNCITKWKNFTNGDYFECPVCRDSVKKINLNPVRQKKIFFCLFKKIIRVILTLFVLTMVAVLFVLFYK